MPAASDRAEGQHEQRQRDDDADELAGAADLEAGAVGDVAAELDLQPGRLGRRGRGLERAEVAHEVGVGDRDVVADVEQHRGAVGGGAGRRDAADVRHVGQPPAQRLDRGRRRRRRRRGRGRRRGRPRRTPPGTRSRSRSVPACAGIPGTS